MEGADRQLGVKVFFARHLEAAASGRKKKASFVPPSSHIIGRFPSLKMLKHPHLCKYIDVINPRYGDRLFVVSEHFSSSLEEKLKMWNVDGLRGLPEMSVKKIAFEALMALRYLEKRGIVHRNISSANVLFDSSDNVKLADYGLYSMTDAGKHVSFPIGNVHYLAPEVLLIEALQNLQGESASGRPPVSLSSKVDVWSLGVLLFEMMTGALPLSDPLNLPKNNSPFILEEISRFIGYDSSLKSGDNFDEVLSKLSIELSTLTQIKRNEIWNKLDESQRKYLATMRRNYARQIEVYSPQLIEVLGICFEVDPVRRPGPSELLNHPYFMDMLPNSCMETWVSKPFARSSLIKITPPAVEKPIEEIRELTDISSMEYLGTDLQEDETLSLSELFALYIHAGGDIEAHLPSSLKLPPPILRLPSLVVNEDGEGRALFPSRSAESARVLLYDPKINPVSLREIIAYFHYKEREQGKQNMNQSGSTNSRTTVVDKRIRRLSVKENDFSYQQKRIIHFKKALRAYPESRSRITEDSRKDVPPVLRGDIWVAILGAPSKEEMDRVFYAIKLDDNHPSDQQIALDVPRCHQYNPLLSSPAGQLKLNRILRAWVRHNPQLNYWQGIDSLLAPFAVLHFTDEPKAFFCLQHIIEIYLEPFFHKEKAVYLQEHLLMFQKLISFIDPQLAQHFREQNFQPDLFAIPWFLTMFAHIFSLSQIWRIWDTILVSPPSLPLFIAVSILEALRELILPLDFNSLILLFSSLPELNIEALMISALELLRTTPPSLTVAIHHSLESSAKKARWWEESVPLEVAREEYCPRISVNDFINIKDRCKILDVRQKDEFAMFNFPGALRVLDITDESKFDLLRRCEFIIVVGKGDADAVQFANRLVKAELPRVALLNGGIEALIADAQPLLRGIATKELK